MTRNVPTTSRVSSEKPFQADRDEGTGVVNLAREQRDSLMLIEVEIGGGNSGVAEKSLPEPRRAARRAREHP